MNANNLLQFMSDFMGEDFDAGSFRNQLMQQMGMGQGMLGGMITPGRQMGMMRGRGGPTGGFGSGVEFGSAPWMRRDADRQNRLMQNHHMMQSPASMRNSGPAQFRQPGGQMFGRARMGGAGPMDLF